MTNTEYVQFTKGQRVTGRYCGHTFDGTVANVEANTAGDKRCVMVDVDVPLVMRAGDPPRRQVMLTVDATGGETYERWAGIDGLAAL